MSLSFDRSRRRHHLRDRHLQPRPIGVAREGGAPEGHVRLFPRVEEPAVVGDRRVADRGQYLGRADRRHVGLGLCDRSRHRVLRMDGGGDFADRRQVLPADLPQEPHLHHAAIPPPAVRQGAADHHGALLARALRVREPDLDHLARLDRGEQGRRNQPECRAGHPRRVRLALPAQGRPQGGGADRHCPGHLAGARRARRRLPDARPNRRGRGRARRLRQADRGRADALPHDPAEGRPALYRPARACRC